MEIKTITLVAIASHTNTMTKEMSILQLQQPFSGHGTIDITMSLSITFLDTTSTNFLLQQRKQYGAMNTTTIGIGQKGNAMKWFTEILTLRI